MRQHRLYVSSTPVIGAELHLGSNEAQYLGKALRLRVGDAISVFDGTGGSYAAIIASIERRKTVLNIVDFADEEVESDLRLTLLQSVSRGERMDFVVQKATELGVEEIYPVFTEFGGVRLDAQRRASRLAHWTGIARNACQQCGRNRIPIIAEPAEFSVALETLTTYDLCIILDPRAGKSLRTDSPGSIAVAVGPEGGFSDSEIALAAKHSFVPVALGPRVLRTETAALAAISVLQTKFGDFRF